MATWGQKVSIAHEMISCGVFDSNSFESFSTSSGVSMAGIIHAIECPALQIHAVSIIFA